MIRLVTLSASFVVTMTLVAAALAAVVSPDARAQEPTTLSSSARALDTRAWSVDAECEPAGGRRFSKY